MHQKLRPGSQRLTPDEDLRVTFGFPHDGEWRELAAQITLGIMHGC